MKRGFSGRSRILLITLLVLTFFVFLYRTFREEEAVINDTVDVITWKKIIFPTVEFGSNRNYSRKVDWHDYEKIRCENSRNGTGEHGEATLLSPEEADLGEASYKLNGFNAFVSDKISLQRSLPDIRHPECRTKNYSIDLPTTSVIIPYYDEHWSTLLRTVYSVIDRAPSHLLNEVILVDDGSTKEFLKKPLDEYVQANFSKVRVIHHPERWGLIRAKLTGAKVATGEVLVFLDSHTEANVNWLPPLIEPIAEDYRTCVCPFIDVIAYDTFKYRAQDEGARGAFDWEFFYKRLPLLDEDKKHPTKPFKSPVMCGGLFAISAKYFWELGGYDEGLDIWGGEQYELSFKIWQCGGQMFDAPCSRIGHVYRKFSPFPNPRKTNVVGKNYKRVAEVWMDEYKEYLYDRMPEYRKLDPGDLSKQKAIRERLQCKPFKWFMDEIAFDLTKRFPPVEPDDFANGTIINELYNECVDTEFLGVKTRFGLKPCLSDNPKLPGRHEQKFRLGFAKDIHAIKSHKCWDVPKHEINSSVELYNCHKSGSNQLWRYHPEKMWLVHGKLENRCLDVESETKFLFVGKCDLKSKSQRWRIQFVNLEQLKKWDQKLF